ncbi:uncharacterized protein LOC100159932 isoform X1 [Acyrthosiphon pisum]|uniref:ACYPI001271 protein n=1 Tax=Acyrthosiphon pisum TaxID=7029 RepID=A0A8R2NSD2_ACYPI|nr:uncharacterized protein LOC100159932 isoform X1 [Acyrthosiphon pisum]
MAQVFKLFCFAISVLLFLQLADAGGSKKDPSTDDAESSDQDGEDQKPTLFKNIDKIKDSKPVQVAKEITSIAKEHLDTFSKDFESTLKAEEEKQKNVDDEDSIVPKVIQNNVVLPAKAFAQTSINTLREPVGNMISNVQQTYADELAKSEQDENYVPIIGSFTKRANKPVALLKASKDIVGNTFGSIFGKASSLWNSTSSNKKKKVMHGQNTS